MSSLRRDFPDQITEPHNHANVVREDRLEIGIVDEKKLLDFIRSLRRIDVIGEKAQRVLSVVATELDENIIRSYIYQYLGREDEQAQKLFEVAGEILSELRRIGLTNAANLIAHHLEHIWKGDLKELLIAEGGNILPGQGFKPHNWHEDSVVDLYRSRWERALEALEQVEENPQASDILKEAFDYLRSSIEVAREYFLGVEKTENKSHYQLPNVNEYREVLAQASRRLNTLRPRSD